MNKKINLTNNVATIENASGEVVKTMFPGNASNSFKPYSCGNILCEALEQ